MVTAVPQELQNLITTPCYHKTMKFQHKTASALAFAAAAATSLALAAAAAPIAFRARLLDPDVSPGTESLEVKLVREEEIPWDQLAFAMVRRTLEHFLEDRRRGAFLTRFGDINPPQR